MLHLETLQQNTAIAILQKQDSKIKDNVHFGFTHPIPPSVMGDDVMIPLPKEFMFGVVTRPFADMPLFRLGGATPLSLTLFVLELFREFRNSSCFWKEQSSYKVWGQNILSY